MRSYSAFLPLALEPPLAAAAIDVDPAPGVDLVVVHAAGGQMRVSIHRGADLSLLASRELDITAPAALTSAWIREIEFPDSNRRLAFGVGGELRHLGPGEILDGGDMVPLIPAPTGPDDPWTDPQTTITFDDAGEQQLAVASATTIHRSRVPTAPPPGDNFAWTAVRDDGAWLGQIGLELTGDAIAEIVGFSPEGAAPGALCGWDLTAGAITCLDTTVDADDRIELVAAALTPGGTRDDLVVVHHAGNRTALVVFPDLRVQGGALDSAPGIDAEVLGEGGQIAVADPTGDDVDRVFVLTRAGEITCLAMGPGMFAACAPAD